MKHFEVNFDGLVGPTHNYAGLSYGNVASQSNAQEASNPKEAAKQGLRKMKALTELGMTQGYWRHKSVPISPPCAASASPATMPGCWNRQPSRLPPYWLPAIRLPACGLPTPPPFLPVPILRMAAFTSPPPT